MTISGKRFSGEGIRCAICAHLIPSPVLPCATVLWRGGVRMHQHSYLLATLFRADLAQPRRKPVESQSNGKCG
jgi:hypothetical protein